jgi:hypothetical protein
MQVQGTAGYLSEWQLSGTVTRNPTSDGEFSGPVVLRHVGLCSPGRPAEMSGTLRYKVTGWLGRRVVASLSLNGRDCGFEGKWSGEYNGELSCDEWRGVPLSLSTIAQ